MAVPRTIKTAISDEDYQRWDSGKRARPKPAPVHPEPAPLKGKKPLALDKISLDNISLAVSGRRNVKRNPDGVRFIGFDVVLQMKEGKDVEGWMTEGPYVELRRLLYREGLVNVDNLEY